MSGETGAVGARLPRIDAREKATGSARYSDDLTLPGMLFSAILGSPYAHARILSYDTSDALAVPGVVAVITGDDYDWHRGGGHIEDETLFAKGKVRYVGEPVAAVAAHDRKTAERAARLVAVEYDELPAVLSLDDAMAGDAPLIHEDFATYHKKMPMACTGNECWTASVAEGDVDGAWDACEVIVEGTFETQAQHHVYLEPSTALADVDMNGKVTMWSPSQGVHYSQHRTAQVLGLPMSKVRAVTPSVGGGFGGRAGPNVQPIAAALALAAARPVKVALSRTADFETMRSRHPSRIRLKLGAKRDGTLIALDGEMLFDGGAYADETPAITSFGLMMGRGPYRIPNVSLHGRGFYTNKLRAGSFRGFGNPQSAFARECLLDDLAAELGMEPMALRLKNAMKPGETWLGGQPVASCGVIECLEKVRDRMAADRAADMTRPAPGKRRGIGVSAFAHISSFLASGAMIQLIEDGTLAVNTGAIDMGQGADTILTQICAEALQVPMDAISYAVADTDTSPYNYKSVGSRTTYTTGRAVLAAANEVRDKIIEHAAEMLECAAVDLELLPGGRVAVKGVPERSVPFAAVAGRSLYRTGGPITATHTFVFDGPPFDPARARLDGIAFGNMGAYIFGAQAVEVEVDEVTGAVAVTGAWVAADVGRAINPAAVEGQLQGGFVQGMGYALIEEMVWDDGRLANPSLMDYKIPGVLETPDDIVALIVEDPEPTGPFGAKGVGEPALVGVAPAVRNAIANATGARLGKLPMTSERVFDALHEE